MGGQDNRKEPRFPVRVDVPAKWSQLEEPAWLAASDISANGIFLDVASPPVAQTMIALGPPNALVHGRVVFVLSPEEAAKIARSPGVGVQLSEPMDVDTWLLRVAEHRAVTHTLGSLDIPLPGARAAASPAAIPLPGASPAAIPLPGASFAAIPIPLPSAVPAPFPAMPGSVFAPASSSVEDAIALPGASVAMAPVPLRASTPAIAVGAVSMAPLPGASIPAIALPGAASASMAPVPLPGASTPAIALPGASVAMAPVPLPGASTPAIALPGASVAMAPVPLPGASTPAIALPGASSGAVPLPGATAGEGRMAGARSHMPEKFERAVPFPTAASTSPMPVSAPMNLPPPPTIRAAIVPATDTRVSAAEAARRMARVPDATDEPAGAEVLIVATDVRAGETLKAALAADDYTPLIARHGLEALALCVRRRPLLAIVPSSMPRLSASLFLRELRAHPELADLRVVVVDDGSEPLDARATARWPKVPDTVQAARRQIDVVADGLRGQARPPRGKEDARELAAMIKALATRWTHEGEIGAAALALRYVVELTPSSHEHAALLAWTIFQADPEANTVEALATLERVLRQQPAYADGWFYKGAILKRGGKAADGEDFLKRALMYEAGHAAARAELERVVEESLELARPLAAPKTATEPSRAPPLTSPESAPSEPARSGGIFGFLRRLFGKK